MSEKAELIYLREKVAEAHKREMSGSLTFIVGFVITVFAYYFPISFDPTITLIIVAIGLFFVFMGAIEAVYFGFYQKPRSMKQLGRMTRKTSCTSCGKKKREDFAFCPYCGAPSSSAAEE